MNKPWSNEPTPLTDEVHAAINNSGGSSAAAFHDMLNHARAIERRLRAAEHSVIKLLFNVKPDSNWSYDRRDALAHLEAAAKEDRPHLEAAKLEDGR